jgi:hypothetical protein
MDAAKGQTNSPPETTSSTDSIRIYFGIKKVGFLNE